MMECEYAKKQCIAEEQLRCAMDLFLDGGVYSCIITLAGAAEEIFGKMLVMRGKQHALEKASEDIRKLHVELWGESVDSKHIYCALNRTKNEMKHLCLTNKPMSGSKEISMATIQILKRALTNYQELTGNKKFGAVLDQPQKSPKSQSKLLRF